MTGNIKQDTQQLGLTVKQNYLAANYLSKREDFPSATVDIKAIDKKAWTEG